MLLRISSDLAYRLRAIFSRRAAEQELDDELRFHLEHEAAKHFRAGVSPADAMRRARLAPPQPSFSLTIIGKAPLAAIWP